MTGTAHHTPWPARAGRGTAGAGERWLLVAAVTLGVLLCGGPLALVALEAIAPEGQPTLDPIADALDSRTTWRALLNSLDSALFSGLIATAIGTAMALAVGLTDVRAKAPLVFLILLPMMIPPHVTAIAWIQALGPGGAVLGALGLAPGVGAPNPLYSREGVIALLAIQHMPLAFLVVRAGLGALPREMVDAARVSGARPARILRRIVLPLLAPTLIAALALTVVSALGNFGIQALLGIPARYTTLPVLMWRRLASFGPQVLSDLAVIAAIIALVAVAVVAVQLALQRRARTALIGPPAAPLAFRLRRARPAVEVALWAWLALVLALPLMSLTATALIPTYGVALTAETVTFENFREVLVRQAVTLRAFANSTLAAGMAAAVLAGFAVVLGYYLARPAGPARRAAGGIAALADIAYAVPGLVISIAFILAFIRPLPVLGVSLYGSLAVILLAYCAAFLSIALKPVGAAYAQLDGALDDAARVAGAGIGRRLGRIFLPLVAPAAASGAILVFLTAYNEVTVSALLWSAGNETIGTVIFNYEDGGYTTLAAAMSVVTVAVTVALMLALHVFGRHLPRGVVPWRA